MNEQDLSQNKPLDPIRNWLARGRELRAEMLERQAALQDELAQINMALQALNEFEGDKILPPEQQHQNVLDMTKAAVLRIMRAKGKVTSPDIFSEMRIQDSAGKARVLKALRELTDAEIISRKGARGSYTYSIRSKVLRDSKDGKMIDFVLSEK